jgi:hypothetical protein
MTAILPYLRVVKVLIGPFEEWRGGGSEDQAIVFTGDGTQSGFRIRFDCHKHVISTSTPTSIEIYNLKKETRNSLQTPGLQVALFVGWLNTELTLLYTGSLLAAPHKRQGPDIITTLLSNAAFGGISRTMISKTFGSGSPIKNIVLNLAKQIPGVSVDPINISITTTTRVGNQGFSFVGPVNEALDRLARVYGFSWWVENKVFYSVEDEKHLAGGKPLISHKNGYLLRAEPMLVTPMQVKSGVSIHSLLHPYIRPGRLIELQSSINPELNNDYVVHSLSHMGDTHGNTWETHCQSWIRV